MPVPFLKKVEIQITTACNMKCGFCFADAGRHATMPVELANKAIVQLAKRREGKTNARSVWFTGGETLLRNDCRVLIEEASAFGLGTGVATNGLLLSQKAASLKAAGLLEVRVSLDSVKPGLFDQIRGTHKALPQVLRGIKAAAHTGLRTGIRYTATKYNCDDLHSVIQRSRELGASYIEVKAVLPIGRGSSDAMVPPDQLSALMNEAISLSTPAMPVHVLCSYLSPCKGFDIGPNHIPCVCATEALYVAVDGKIMPCSYFPQASALNIKSHTLREAWKSNGFAQIRNERPEKCEPCETWEPCRNGCPALLAHYSDYQTSCFTQAEHLRWKGLNGYVCAHG